MNSFNSSFLCLAIVKKAIFKFAVQQIKSLFYDYVTILLEDILNCNTNIKALTKSIKRCITCATSKGSSIDTPVLHQGKLTKQNKYYVANEEARFGIILV